jgi:septum formation protein
MGALEGAARRLVLASASPRRRELLDGLGLTFDVIPADVPETFPGGVSAERIACDLALAKAKVVVSGQADCLALGADTLVVLGEWPDEAILGKPADAAEARRMLESLSGVTHRVITGMAVVWRNAEKAASGSSEDLHWRSEAVTTRVIFRPLAAHEIDAYVTTGEPMDKAGAYAIQGGAASFVESVEGDYYNVVGLSLAAVVRLLDGLVPVRLMVPAPPPVPFRIVP